MCFEVPDDRGAVTVGLHEQAAGVRTSEDFARFLGDVLVDLRNRPEECLTGICWPAW